MQRHIRLGTQVIGMLLVATACSSGDEGGSGAQGVNDAGSPFGGSTGAGVGGGVSVGGGVGVGGGAGVGGGPALACGNGTLDPGEDCETGNLNGQSCASATMNALPGGTLGCNQCRYDLTGCLGGPAGAGGSGAGNAAGSGGAPVLGSGGMVGGGNTGNVGGGTSGGTGETGRMVGMTDAHNQIRQGVATSNPIPGVTWSSDIAAVAQAYADQLASQGCNMVHSQNPAYGENLAWLGGGAGSAPEVVNMWAGESACWVPGAFMRTDQCNCADGQCGHYTQIVWRGTTQIGCGVATCPGSEIWVCNYSPPGNTVGQPVY